MIDDHTFFHRRKLPHYQPWGRSLFITYRTSDPVPEHLMREFRDYQQQLQSLESEKKDDKELCLVNQKKLFACMDGIYTRYQGNINLTKNPKVASTISDIIHEHHGQLYHLYAYTLMPNHVHLVLRPNIESEIQVSLSQIMNKIKGVSAREANKILNRQGSLWSREYYDLWPRTGDELIRIIEYVRQNPVAAGLVKDAADWPWTWVNTQPEYM